MKKAFAATGAAALMFGAVACNDSDADVVSHNISKDADYFKVPRKIVFFNGITDKYLLTIEGFCSLGNDDPPRELSVVCKTGPDEYKKHFLGLSDNVSWFAEQTESVTEDAYHYKIYFKPETVIPNFDRP